MRGTDGNRKDQKGEWCWIRENMVKVHFIDWFVYEALALQTWGPEFDPQNSPLKKVWKHVLVILVLER